MRILLIVVIVAVAVAVIFLLPFLTVKTFYIDPLEQKRQGALQFEKLYDEWKATDCSGDPPDALCKAAVGFVVPLHFPEGTERCSDVTPEAIEILRAECG